MKYEDVPDWIKMDMCEEFAIMSRDSDPDYHDRVMKDVYGIEISDDDNDSDYDSDFDF